MQKNIPTLQAEDKFILLCARMQMEKNLKELALTLAKAGLSWQQILIKSRINLVTPLIYKNLLNLDIQIPDYVIEEFKTDYILQNLINQRRYQDLKEILKIFNTENIPVILYKGGFLGEIVYQDIALRPMADFDLLIKPKDWPRIASILSKLNYNYPAKITIPKVPKEFHIGCGNKNGTGLEFKFWVYWLDIPEFSNQSIWQDAIRVKIQGIDVLVPSPEDHLLILSLGLLRHRYFGLIWFCDIRELINHYKEKINWQRLLEKAKQKRVANFLYYGLLFSHQMLEAKIPFEILKCLKPNYLRHKVFIHFHNIDHIIKLKGNVERIFSSPKSHLLQLFFIDKLCLNPKILLKTIFYFLRLILK